MKFTWHLGEKGLVETAAKEEGLWVGQERQRERRGEGEVTRHSEQLTEDVLVLCVNHCRARRNLYPGPRRSC